VGLRQRLDRRRLPASSVAPPSPSLAKRMHVTGQNRPHGPQSDRQQRRQPGRAPGALYPCTCCMASKCMPASCRVLSSRLRSATRQLKGSLWRRVKQARTEGSAEKVASGAAADAATGPNSKHASPAQTKPAAASKPAMPGSGRKRSTPSTPHTQSASASAPPDKLVGRRVKVQ
jgi:hypothetical protein